LLLRFCLYGFLKNQRYFEPFLFLIFLDQGLSFFTIGLLIGLRELTVHLLEIPSGAIADHRGRRLSLSIGFAAYLASFLLLASAQSLKLWVPGMILYGVGDAFRSGSHKALIFRWLELQDRAHERTEVYGRTRSWSKFGSALSSLVGAAVVLITGQFSWLFYASAVPCFLDLLNVASYPSAIDIRKKRAATWSSLWRHTLQAVPLAWHHAQRRRLLVESLAFEGTFIACKDYLQPVLLAAAAALTLLPQASPAQRTAVLVGSVFFLLFLASGFASRLAHRLVDRAGGADRAGTWLWRGLALISLLLLAAGWWHQVGVLIVAFVVFYLLQNLWRPILVTRLDEVIEEGQRATLLSLESQSRRVSGMLLAPLVGALVDLALRLPAGGTFWPIGALGLLISLPFACGRPRGSSRRIDPRRR
jgi:hypothetical protein